MFITSRTGLRLSLVQDLRLPDISFIQNSLTELPENLVDTESLIANSCIARGGDTDDSFIITESGGLPNRPGEASTSNFPTGDVQTIPDDDSSTHDDSWQPREPIIEAQGVYQLPTGELIISHECSE
ncbi:MAG: hypothetical protein ACFE0I_19075 [Elainellaceae cyanobacterium]